MYMDQYLVYHKEYRESHKEQLAQQNKAYYEANKERIAERGKQYREAHKEQKKEKDKQYYEANKKTIIEKQGERVTCECGASVCRGHMTRHKKTKKHQIAMKEKSVGEPSQIHLGNPA